MTCHEIQNMMLTDNLDGEASADVNRSVEQHLAGCQTCRELLSVARKLEADLRPSPAVQPPAYLWDQIREKVEAEPFSLRDGILVWWQDVLAGFRPAFVRGSLAAAMLVLLVVFVPYFVQRGPGTVASNATQISPLAYLDDSGEVALETGESGFGSVVERYL
jgi:anti-sigma factor RsiW